MLKRLKGWKLGDWQEDSYYAQSHWTYRSMPSISIRIDEYVAENPEGAREIVQACLNNCAMAGVRDMLRPDLKADIAYGEPDPLGRWALFARDNNVTYIRNIGRDPASVILVAMDILAIPKGYRVSWRRRVKK